MKTKVISGDYNLNLTKVNGEIHASYLIIVEKLT